MAPRYPCRRRQARARSRADSYHSRSGAPLRSGAMRDDQAADRRFLAGSRYLDLKYSQARAPRGTYPQHLARWLLEHVYERPGRLLDLGSGRGDHLAAFAELGFEVTGVDISPRS